jgi:hypothetical protein
MDMWQCNSCGYVWDGEEPPHACPKCEAAEARFVELDGRAAALIEQARFTNSLLMHLSLLLEQVMDLAEDGLDDNFDPRCAKIFQQAGEQAEVLQQAIKAELQSHVKSGKWG